MSDDSEGATRLLSTREETQRRVAQEFVGKSAVSREREDTESLLQSRLKIAATALLVLNITLLARDVVFGFQAGERIVGIGQSVLLVAAIAVLYSGRKLDLRSLRIVEIIVFAMPAFRISYLSYWSILEFARQRNEVEIPREMLATTLAFFALITFYGMFVPNTVRRASIIIGSFGVVFILLLPVMSVHDPRAWQFIWTVVDVERRSTMVLDIIFAVGISIAASSIISTLRSEVTEARELGQYRLTDMIGKGGMGEVWKAEHALLARPAAVKLIRPEVLDPGDPDKAESMIRRFEREAQMTARLQSVHSVEIYDFGITDAGVFYFVMELLDGIDLETLVNENGPLSAGRARYLIRQACDSLQEAHEKGLVHRDIKPANILACSLGGQFDFVKVLDFGLAKPRDADVSAEEAKLTREGMVIGTPAYMPPETITQGISDARSDIYALGCVMFWMVTGRLLFEGAGAMSMVMKHAQEAPERPSVVSELEIPQSFDRVVLACLEKDPDGRPQSAAEVKAMLDECDLDDWSEADAREWWAVHG